MADVPPPRRWPALDIRFPPDADASLLAERLYFLLDDFQPTAIEETETASDTDAEAETGTHVGWRVFFGSSDARDNAAAALAAIGAPDSLLTAIAIDIDDDNWAARSQASLRAVRVGDLVVAPPWDARAVSDSTIQDGIQIIIMPSMGFGTGHHASTRLCLTALQTRRLTGARVLDVGTGSGVLAIAAAKLGGASVLGIDNDADAIASASENLALNACDSRVMLREVALDRLGDEGPFDVVLANLTWAPLVDQAPFLKRLLNRAGVLIASGFTLDEEDRVRSAYSDLTVDGRWVEETWVALAFRAPFPAQHTVGADPRVGPPQQYVSAQRLSSPAAVGSPVQRRVMPPLALVPYGALGQPPSGCALPLEAAPRPVRRAFAVPVPSFAVWQRSRRS